MDGEYLLSSVNTDVVKKLHEKREPDKLKTQKGDLCKNGYPNMLKTQKRGLGKN